MKKHNGMRPQDVMILLKVAAHAKEIHDYKVSDGQIITGSENSQLAISRFKPLSFFNPLPKKVIASELGISPAEVTESLARSSYAGLYAPANQTVKSLALLDFLQYGLKYVFPQQPGPIARGIPTAHSAKPLSSLISSKEVYVWPYANGTARGQAIEPLYPSVAIAIQNDERLYELLALTDAIRIGRAREVNLAIEELKKRILVN
ncbi:hypothetical protein ACO2Q8_02360 [Larkinella sp. VNQ87]|uniref:hypothetical protein n=1 Tax=Larkinella sp. VNQ87 TaxID=3400921 RepID=UPI003C0A0939